MTGTRSSSRCWRLTGNRHLAVILGITRLGLIPCTAVCDLDSLRRAVETREPATPPWRLRSDPSHTTVIGTLRPLARGAVRLARTTSDVELAPPGYSPPRG